MLQLLEKLVNIDSGTYVKHGVDQVVPYLGKNMKKWEDGVFCFEVMLGE